MPEAEAVESEWTRPRAWVRAAVGLACVLVGALAITPSVCRRGAAPVWADDPPTMARYAAGVERWIAGPLAAEQFTTGSPLFDGEWLFGTYLMAGLGFGQLALAAPPGSAERGRYATLLGVCLDRLISDEVRGFDAHRHGEDPLLSLPPRPEPGAESADEGG